MGWKIIKDCGFSESDLAYGITSREGKTFGDYQGGKHRYRMLDDDGNKCYYILSDTDPSEGTESQLFAPLDWAMMDVGATEIQYKDAESGEYKTL